MSGSKHRLVSLGCEIQLEVWYFELLNFPGSLASSITAGPGKRRQASLSGIWYRCSSISYRNTNCFPLITAFALPFVTLKKSWMAFRRYTTELHWQLTVRSVTRAAMKIAAFLSLSTFWSSPGLIEKLRSRPVSLYNRVQKTEIVISQFYTHNFSVLCLYIANNIADVAANC